MKKVLPLQERPGLTTIAIQALQILAMMIGGFMFGVVVGVGVASAITGLELENFVGVTNYSQMSNEAIDGIKIIQFFYQLGLFLLPALLLPMLMFRRDGLTFTGLRRSAPIQLFFLALLLFISAYSLIELSIYINQQLDLRGISAGLDEWVRNTEATNMEVMERFLGRPGIDQLIINIILMAALPALAEEIFFRGLLQRTFYLWFGKRHLAVWLTAIIFSTFHFQFLGFVPRMLLGALLGYVYLWSGSLWVPIFIHFMNNALAVIVTYMAQTQGIDSGLEDPQLYPVYIYILSALFCGGIIFLFVRAARQVPVPQFHSKSYDEWPVATPGDTLDTAIPADPSTPPNWIRIHRTESSTEANIIAGKLEHAGLRAVVVNKRDSAYTSFGVVELYVHPDDEMRARDMLGL